MDWNRLTQKKKALDKLRPLPKELESNLSQWLRVELTFTSNALEGSTLTRQEPAVVIEKGMTVSGHSMRELQEAANHAKALDWVQEAALSRHPPQERDILLLHDLILKGIDDANAGRYRNVPVRIAGSRVILPNPRKVPELMEDLAAYLKRPGGGHPAQAAGEAHYRLVSIHPFVDGNGRTARLLMNLMLMKAGYPPAFIRKRDRAAYLNALEKAQLGGPKEDFERLVFVAVDRSLDIYLKAGQGESGGKPVPVQSGLMRIGELAKRTGEAHSTLRHWTHLGLLKPQASTESGYLLYGAESVDRAKRIRQLQDKRNTLVEIRELLEKES